MEPVRLICSMAKGSCGAGRDLYLKALLASGSADHIEYGTYVSRVKAAPLVVKDEHGLPNLVRPAWSVMIQDGLGGLVAACGCSSGRRRSRPGRRR